MGASVRIVSANLWAGSAEGEAFACLAAELGADVVAVQELGGEQAEALGAVFPHGRLEPREDHDGGGIALARPAEVERLPLHLRHGFRAQLDPDAWPELDAPLEVWNVHVFAPHAGGGLGLFRRRPQFRDLARHLCEPAPTGRVVVGDFNSTPAWPLYRRMRGLMEDAAITVARREGRRPQATWGPRPWAPRVLRIDHGFVEGVVPEAFRVVTIPGSDHSAVVLDVAVGEGRFR